MEGICKLGTYLNLYTSGCGSVETPKVRHHRWCFPCSKKHGAVDVKDWKCEGCKTKRAIYGLPTEAKTRWCVSCAKDHEGAQHGAGGGVTNEKEKVASEGAAAAVEPAVESARTTRARRK